MQYQYHIGDLHIGDCHAIARNDERGILYVFFYFNDHQL